MENNVYKGRVRPYITNYKGLGEMIWTKIKNHGDKIVHVSKFLYQYQVFLQKRTFSRIQYLNSQEKNLKKEKYFSFLDDFVNRVFLSM